jgi:hypothetical protein
MDEDRYRYWLGLKKANFDFRKTYPYDDLEEEKKHFQKWMLEVWGISIGWESQGYTGNFEIKDQRKFLLFELKYGSTRL